MREVRFDPSQVVPEIDARVSGRCRNAKVHLVFDTGSGITQLDTTILENLGYSAKDALQLMSVRGATGEAIEGYVVSIKRINVFGREFQDVPVLGYDFENFPEIDGLLGFDVIKQLHLEMDGPAGLLRIY